MSIQDIRSSIGQEVIGTQSKKVFLVEGPDDKVAFTILFNRFLPLWEQHWGIAAAGNKRQLLELLKLEPDWVGIVDRDEWDQPVIDQYMSERANLCVLPRFCIENYLIQPLELWPAIPAVRQEKIAGGESAFTAAIEAELYKYLRHGALWKVVTPLWSGLRAIGFKEALASEESLETVQSDREIKRILVEWGALLEPVRIFADFQTEFSKAEVASVTEQLSVWVHGKVFWKNVVYPTMKRQLGQMKEGELRKQILRMIPKPVDLQPLLERLSVG
jgi:hypothetical protein